MDSMEKAVDFVASHPRVSSSGGVGLIGVSKGMEVVLSMAAFLPEGKVFRLYFFAGKPNCKWDTHIKNSLVGLLVLKNPF